MFDSFHSDSCMQAQSQEIDLPLLQFTLQEDNPFLQPIRPLPFDIFEAPLELNSMDESPPPEFPLSQPEITFQSSENWTNAWKNFIKQLTKFVENHGKQFFMTNEDILEKVKKGKGVDGYKQLEKIFQRVKERLKKRIKDNKIFSVYHFETMVIYKEEGKKHLSRYLLQMSSIFARQYEGIVNRSERMKGPLNKKIIQIVQQLLQHMKQSI